MNHPDSEVTPEISAAHAGEACAHAAYAGAPHAFKMPPQEGYKGTPEEIERQWMEQAYTGRGDSMRQLTVRSTLLGCLLGGIMAVPNLYLGLKSGITMSVGLTATLMAFVLWQALLKLRLAKGKLTVLEYNAMASTASAAGYCTVGVLVSSVAAFILINDRTIPLPWLMLWVLCVAGLGVTMAIPMKRQIINVEQLPFPGSIAGAETLQLLVEESKDSVRSARALVVAGLVGAADTVWEQWGAIVLRCEEMGFWKKPTSAILERLGVSYWVDSANTACVPQAWQARTVMGAWDIMLFSSGAFMGLRMCATLLVSGTLCWAVYVPAMQQAGFIHENTLRANLQYTLWGAASCMVVSGLVTVAFQWRAFVKAGRSLGRLFGGGKAPTEAKGLMAGLEAPMSWFFVGQVVGAAGLAFVGEKIAHIPWWQTVLAVGLSFFLALITCRICGETNSSPHSAMSKVTQFTFGALNPVKPGMDGAAKAGQMNINLMAAGITTGAACNAADLLSDLKTGYYLGAHPRKQFLAQFFGIFAGVLASVVVFSVLVPNKAALEGKDVCAVDVGSGEHAAKWELPAALESKISKIPAVGDQPAKAQVVVDAEVLAALRADPKVGSILVPDLGATLPVETTHIAAKFPAPSAFAWKGISEAVAGGWAQMPAAKLWTMAGGALVGLLLTLIPKLAPSTARWMPSAGVVGSGWLFFWYMSLLMFLGALATFAWQKRDKQNAGVLLIPVASGLFVGSSLMAVVVSLFTDGPGMVHALLQALGR